MFKFIFVAVILISCNSGKTINCDFFKTGRYLYHSNYSGRDYLINRTDSIQTETLLHTNDLSSYRVEWISPCEYNIISEDTINGNISIKILKNEIISFNSDYYVVKGSMDSVKNFRIDTLRVFSGD